MTDLSTLGDFGAGGPRSRAGDSLIDKNEAGVEAATGLWEFEASTVNVVAWHIPGTPKTLQLWFDDPGWLLQRAQKQIAPRQDTLADGLDVARQYMSEHPEGSR